MSVNLGQVTPPDYARAIASGLQSAQQIQDMAETRRKREEEWKLKEDLAAEDAKKIDQVDAGPAAETIEKYWDGEVGQKADALNQAVGEIPALNDGIFEQERNSKVFADTANALKSDSVQGFKKVKATGDLIAESDHALKQRDALVGHRDGVVSENRDAIETAAKDLIATHQGRQAVTAGLPRGKQSVFDGKVVADDFDEAEARAVAKDRILTARGLPARFFKEYVEGDQLRKGVALQRTLSKIGADRSKAMESGAYTPMMELDGEIATARAYQAAGQHDKARDVVDNGRFRFAVGAATNANTNPELAAQMLSKMRGTTVSGVSVQQGQDGGPDMLVFKEGNAQREMPFNEFIANSILPYAKSGEQLAYLKTVAGQDVAMLKAMAGIQGQIDRLGMKLDGKNGGGGGKEFNPEKIPDTFWSRGGASVESFAKTLKDYGIEGDVATKANTLYRGAFQQIYDQSNIDGRPWIAPNAEDTAAIIQAVSEAASGKTPVTRVWDANQNSYRDAITTTVGNRKKEFFVSKSEPFVFKDANERKEAVQKIGLAATGGKPVSAGEFFNTSIEPQSKSLANARELLDQAKASGDERQIALRESEYKYINTYLDLLGEYHDILRNKEKAKKRADLPSAPLSQVQTSSLNPAIPRMTPEQRIANEGYAMAFGGFNQKAEKKQ